MKDDYASNMAEAEACLQDIDQLLAESDPADAPFRQNPVSRAQMRWYDVSRQLAKAAATYTRFNQVAKAKELLDKFFDLVDTCRDVTHGGLALPLFVAIAPYADRFEKFVPDSRQRIKQGLIDAIAKKLQEHEFGYWWLAAKADRSTNESRRAFELWRDLADNDAERRIVDDNLCKAMVLAAQTCIGLGKWDGAISWFRDAAEIAQDRLGESEWASELLQQVQMLHFQRMMRPTNPAFIQALLIDDPSSPVYEQAMDQLDLNDQLNVLLNKGIRAQQHQRFLPTYSDFISEYATVTDKLNKLLNDPRLLLDNKTIEQRAATYRNVGLAGVIDNAPLVDQHGNERGEFGFIDRFVEQYIMEVEELVGGLLLEWQSTGQLTADELIQRIMNSQLKYNWQIVQIGIARHFEQDYISAVHTLVPQFENVVRAWVRDKGGITKRHKQGIAGEMFLNELVSPDNQEVKQLMGVGLTDLIFWYMTNNVSRFDYRNKVAHGWITPEVCNTGRLSAMVIWLLLKLLYGERTTNT